MSKLLKYKKAHAALRIFADSIDPISVSATLKLPATYSHRTNEPRFLHIKNNQFQELRPFEFGMWIFSTEGFVGSNHLETHILWLLTLLEPKTNDLLALFKPDVSKDIFCYSLATTPRKPAITIKTQERIKMLNLKLDIDHYTVTEEELIIRIAKNVK